MMYKPVLKWIFLLTGLLLITTTVMAKTAVTTTNDVMSSKADLLTQIDADSERTTYIVVLYDTPLASYRGDLPGLAATHPATRGEAKLDAKSADSQAYLTYLDAQRTAAITEASQTVGRPLDIQYEYKATINGFATMMNNTEAAAVQALDSVWFVEEEKISTPMTDAGPDWINADDIWAGVGTLSGTYGEGIIVGIIDTGIDPWNPSFATTGDDAYTHTNPLGSGNYLGVCDPANVVPPPGAVAYDPTFPCNDKLIGVWGYIASNASPRDTDGHGSHTASTAAGNFVNDTNITTPTDVYTATISGVAPHANIIAYDGCIDDGGCPGASLNAARDQALMDGVDAINYSIGSSAPTGDPWSDSESLQWLALRDAGVFVSTSAGNSGPGSETIGSPGDIPWITTVGANSHARAFLTSIILDNGVDTPVMLDGFAMTSGYGPAPVVYAADYPPFGDDARLCADGVFAPGTFSGEIVVCERGIYGRVDKGQTVLDGGAGGYILAQPEAEGGGPGSLATDPHVLPAIHITYDDYMALQNYVGLTGSANGTISGATQDVDAVHGDIMAAFSSRGPNRSIPDIIVPSVTAPGRAIWAAYHQGDGGDGDFTFNVIQGTSMSSPHVAGAGALMKALHPTWTPAEIQSALMTTGRITVLNDDGIEPTTANVFDIGSGHIDLAKAGLAALLFDETTTDYQDADPGSGGNPQNLNLASLGDGDCVGTCSWTRTASRPGDTHGGGSMTWNATYVGAGAATITPNQITLNPGESVSFDVDLDVSALAAGQWHFGQVIWTEDSSDAPEAHLPVAVYLSPPDIEVDPEQIESTQPAGTAVDKTLTISNNGAIDLNWTIEEAQAAFNGGGTPVVFWDQPSLGGSGIVSTYFTDNNGGTYSAADFKVSFNTQVTEIYTPGFINGANLDDATQLTWFVYADDGGEPAGQPEDGGGTEFWTFSTTPTATGVDVSDDAITLDLLAAGAPALDLTPGTYWLVVFPDIDTITYGRWNWFQANQVNAEAVLTDPGGNFGSPDPSWTKFSDVGLSFTDVAFTLTGIVDSGCDNPSEVSWITTINPANGTTAPQSSTQVDVTLDATGLTPGIYNAALCVNSNDPDTPQAAVAVELVVLASAPLIDVMPDSLASTQPPNITTDKTLTLKNVGSAPLTWTAYEAQSLTTPDEIVSDPLAKQDTGAIRQQAAVTTEPHVAAAHVPSAVLYDQTANITTSGFNSQEYSPGNAAFTNQGADDFVIPVSDGAWVIESVEAPGFYANGTNNGPASIVNVYIYADGSGSPGAAVYTGDGLTPTSSASGTLIVDLPTDVILPAGTYWVSVQADMNFSPFGQWFWFMSSVQTNSAAAWRNPGNGFGSGCTTWTDVTACGASQPDFAFRLNGRIAASCDLPGDIPWASVSPTNGVTAAGEQTDVVVTFDSTGLSNGVYEGTLCFTSDDPTNPLVEVPLTLTVDASCTAISLVAPQLSNSLSGSDMILNWNGDAANLGGYDIHRSGSPYFTPGGANLIAGTRPPGTTTYTDMNVLAPPPFSSFYLVNALNCDVSATAVSNEVGVFSFKVEPGTP